MTQHIQAALEHAKQNTAQESCGLFIVRKGQLSYVPCANIADDPKKRFAIAPADWMRAESMGEIVGIAHSHPDSRPLPSQADLVACEKSGLPWTIVNPRTDETYTFSPEGYKAPLFGREYCHGVLDCYSFVRDFYAETYGVILNDYVREEDWWEKGFNLYRDYFEVEGFRKISREELRPGDGIVMRICSDIDNHGAIYLGNNQIAHHLYKKLSSRDIYGLYYQRSTTMYVRHKDMF